MITCPKCSYEFEPTDAVKKEVEEKLREEFSGKWNARMAEIKARTQRDHETLLAGIKEREAGVAKAIASPPSLRSSRSRGTASRPRPGTPSAPSWLRPMRRWLPRRPS
jgi:hypothetical protein